MNGEMSTRVKHREIRFCPLHPEPNQAHSALPLLCEMDGVLKARPATSHLVYIRYDVTQITLRMIDETLVALGYHLDTTLLSKLKRALYYYTEDTQRANLGVETDNGSMQVFISRYQRIPHGCRDQRPDHWRNYL